MPINNITQTISTIPEAGSRGVDVQTQFVIKQEDFQDHLQGTTVTELNTLKDQLNTRIGEINSTATTMNGYADTASAGASTATTKAGEASTSASEALTSRNQASTFATNSSNSAVESSTSATLSNKWANEAEDVVVDSGQYSAYHWAKKAEASQGEIISAGTGLTKSGTTLNFTPDTLTTATSDLVSTDFVVVIDSTIPKKITLTDFTQELTSASESTRGILELATSAETIIGTDMERAITPAGLMSAFNKTGSAPMFACRAWVNFNGTGTVAIRASGNVSSITDNGTGDYTVNFTTAMVDANYLAVGSCDTNPSWSVQAVSMFVSANSNTTIAPTANNFRLSTREYTGSGHDETYINVSVFR